MTVAELITKLQAMPQGMKVVTEHTEYYSPEDSMGTDVEMDIEVVSEYQGKVVLREW